MKRLVMPFLMLILLNINLYSKNEGFSFEIPDSLKKNADAVYLFHDLTYIRTSKTNLKELEHLAITILSDRGDYFAQFILGYDKFSSIDNIECTLYNSAGEKIRKIKKSDIRDYSAYDGFSLFSDNRLKEFKALNPTYPYTIELEVETNYNGFIGIPTWYLIDTYNQGIKETSLTIKYPAEFPVHFKENSPGNFARTEYTEDKLHCIKWESKQIKPIEKEKYSPPFFDQVPTVSFSPVDFKYDNYSGSYHDWNSLGSWLYSLLEKDYQFKEQTKNYLNLLKVKFPDKKDLARQVYKYMQGRTRYVGIQLGIGGIKPFSPEIVDNVGYGDCKALSFYTKSLLDFVGIQSIYTIIGANNRKIKFEDFANINQSNHAILCVPFEKDTVWLECTSQTAPFNHLFEGTTGRLALLVTPEGGKLVKTPEPAENKQEKFVTVKMNPNNEFSCEMTTRQTGSFYDEDFEMLQLSGKELNERLINESGISDLTLINAKIKQEEKVPELEINEEFSTKSFVSKAGSRLFIEMSPFSSIKKMVEQKNERRNPVFIEDNDTYYDEVIFQLPDGYSVEHLPEMRKLSSEFGSYFTDISLDANKIKYQQTFKLNKGTHPKEKYSEFIRFVNGLAEVNKGKIILCKK